MTTTAQQLGNGDEATRRPRVGLLARVGGWSAAHPRRACGVWVVVLVAALGASMAVGSAYSGGHAIPGTESQRAIDVLTRAFPAQAGDSDQNRLPCPV